MFKAKDNDFANDKPTNKLPLNPGPNVTAIAVKSVSVVFAFFKAKSITGKMFF
jgi:hypothetical protein